MGEATGAVGKGMSLHSAEHPAQGCDPSTRRPSPAAGRGDGDGRDVTDNRDRAPLSRHRHRTPQVGAAPSAEPRPFPGHEADLAVPAAASCTCRDLLQPRSSTPN